jgi:hypothetical protein
MNRAGHASAAVATLMPPKLAALNTVKAQTSLLNAAISLPSCLFERHGLPLDGCPPNEPVVSD